MQRSIWLYSEFFRSLWLGLHCEITHCKRGFLWIEIAYIIQFFCALNPGNWRAASISFNENFQRWFCGPPGDRLRTLESFCTYLTLSTAVYAAFLDPLPHNACRSCLLKMFWLIVHLEKCWAHVGNVLFTFFSAFFLTSFLIW